MTPIPMDYSRLLARIKMRDMTRCGVAMAAGIDPGRMIKKLDGKVAFKIDEIDRICEVLEIPVTEISAYFYTPKGDEEIPEVKQPSVSEQREKLIDYGTDLMKPGSCRRKMRGARVMEVIEVRAMVGSGTRDDPTREQVTYWTLDGELLGYGL